MIRNIDSAAIESVCRRIVEAVGTPVRITYEDLFITASIGISMFPGDATDSEALLRCADASMYRAKENGRNQFRFFASDIEQSVQRRHALESGLRLAIQQQDLTLHYQPEIRLSDGALIGAEALLRWTDPLLGNVSPAEFIPLAERAGLISGVGNFVVRRALADIAAWRAAGLDVPPVALNISPSQLRDGKFVPWFVDAIAAAQLPRSALVVELTEGAVMEQGDTAMRAITQLAESGIRISIDDFGTGYSSLAYLRRLPISELKIDRSFIDGIVDNADDRAIASVILSLARTLGLAAVAEGVENQRQLGVLQSFGCETVQGYLFHRPLEAVRFARLLQEEATTPPGDVEAGTPERADQRRW